MDLEQPGEAEALEAVADELLSTSNFLFLDDRIDSSTSSASSLFTESRSAMNAEGVALMIALGSMSLGDSVRTWILLMRNW